MIQPRNIVNGLKIYQLNSHHSQAASANLLGILSKSNNFIAFIQEPYAPRGKVANIPKGASVFTSNSHQEQPRSCIIASKAISIWPMLNFSDRDTVTVSVTVKLNSVNKTVWMVSSYMPGDTDADVPPLLIRRVVEHCSQSQIPLIIHCDANAHHVTWGSRNNNGRGESLFEFLMETDMYVCNVGCEPTFVVANRQEVIDLTLASTSALNFVQEWRVGEKASLSDHKMISYVCAQPVPVPQEFRNIRKINKEAFHAYFMDHILGIRLPESWSIADIDCTSETVNRLLNQALEHACPMKTITPRSGDKCWWTKELSALRRAARKLQNRAYRTKKADDWAAFKHANRMFKKQIRIAKRESWRLHCLSLGSVSAMSKAIKMLKREKNTVLGPVKDLDGRYTDTPQKTLECMLTAHYPRCNNDLTTQAISGATLFSDLNDVLAKEVITEEKVRLAIHSFQPFKSPGADNIYPVMLQITAQELSPILVKLFRACLIFGYTPRGMREARVVFIPKPGKTDYRETGSFRPITLTSFLLKTLEKMVLWYLQGGAERLLDREPHQYAYRAGLSTDTALHRLTAEIEKSVFSQRFALAVFMDIKGAFSHLSHASIISALRESNCHWVIVRLIIFLLRNQLITASLSGCEIRKRATRGCPQGGVLSPKLFSLVVDRLLRDFREGAVRVQAFADDICAVVRGTNINALRDIMQEAINNMVDWSYRCGLDFAPEKTVVVVFTKKVKWNMIRPLTLKNKILPLSKTVKYLGIILDSRLSWLPEIKNKVAKAKAIMIQCKRVVGKTWGATPKIMLWIYRSIVRPILSYAVSVWSPGLQTVTGRKELTKVQRLALLCITSAYPGTPTAAIEALLCLLPIDLFLQSESVCGMHRLIRTGQFVVNHEAGTTANPGHAAYIKKFYGKVPLLGLPTDAIIPYFEASKNFCIRIDNRLRVQDVLNSHISESGIVCYTDGSKIENGNTGAGVVLPEQFGYNDAERVVPLGIYTTVFQAELVGIKHACDLLRRELLINKKIVICSDSQAALKALENPVRKSKAVEDCLNSVNQLGVGNDVTLMWVPGHTGIAGNEAADACARAASNMKVLGPEPFLPVSASLQRHAVVGWANQKHAARWRTLINCRHSRNFLPVMDSKLAQRVLGCSRQDIRRILQCLTGHNNLGAHQYKIGASTSPLCPKCRVDDETAKHHIANCQHFRKERMAVFGCLDLPTFPGWSVNHLGSYLRFLRLSKRLDEHG